MDELELINLAKQASVAAASGDRTAAIRMYKEVLKHQPNNEAVLMDLVSLLEDDEERHAYLQRVLEINPFNEDARKLLRAFDGAEESAPPEEPVGEILHCYYHPDRETQLRCNKCGKPICIDCAVRTPVGFRCKECVRELQDKFYDATTGDIIKGSIAAFVGGLLIGGATYLLALLLGGLGFFGFLAAFFMGPALGGAMAEMTRRAMNKRRARHFATISALALITGFLIVGLGTGVLFRAIITSLIVILMATTTFYARLKF